MSEIIDLDGIRIQWGLPSTPLKQRCEHKSLVYSSAERRIWCQNCERTIDNFDAFMTFTKHFESMLRHARIKLQEATDAMKTSVRRRATKVLDRAWSGNVMAPCCPHCRGGLLPEDFADRGLSMCSRDIELARRKKVDTNSA